MKNKLYLIVSLYNQENVVDSICQQLVDTYDRLIKEDIINKESKIVLINNGSTDNTLKKLKDLNKNYIIYLNTLKYDIEDSLLLGLYQFVDNYDMAITIDNNINKLDINKLLNEYNNGYDIVYETMNYKKKKINYLFGFTNHYLITNKVVKYLKENKDINTSLKELLTLLSFKQKRIVNNEEYKIKIYELWHLFLKNNNKPLKIIEILGFINVFLSITTFITLLILLFIYNLNILFIILSFIWIILSFVLLSMGIVGHYLYNDKKKINYYVMENSNDINIL